MVEKIITPGEENFHPSEVMALYGPSMERAVFLDDFSEVSPGVNRNQVQAVEGILATIQKFEERGGGVIIGLFGPMFSGKTTVNCLLAENFSSDDLVVYKHLRDVERTGENLVSNGKIQVEAELYESVEEIDLTKKILIVDEFQFDEADNEETIRAFLSARKEKGRITIISQLDFNFRRDPWQTTEIVVPECNRLFVLRAKCDECGGLAQFVQRNIDGKPAHKDDQEIKVGAKEDYQAKCWQCQQVGGKPRSGEGVNKLDEASD